MWRGLSDIFVRDCERPDLDLPTDVRPELLQLVGQRVPHHLHPPSHHGARYRAVLRGMIGVRDPGADEVPADLRKVERLPATARPGDHTATQRIPCTTKEAPLAEDEVPRIRVQE